MDSLENTRLFEIDEITCALVETTLDEVRDALVEKGYDPVSQIVGYLVSGDSGYITNYNGARDKILTLDRAKVLEVIVLRKLMKCLGMDLGSKTLGLATSDKLGLIASPYKTLRYDDMESLVSEVTNLITELKIEVLVLGYPKNMNNSTGESVERVMRFKSMLEGSTKMDVVLIDERLSTVEAEKYLLDEDKSRSNRKKIIDAVAASIILDTYLRKEGK